LPLNRPPLALDSSPRSVQEARRWAGDVCRDLGRPDLTETSELAITELVTNAVLHAEPPVSLRVAGTFDHPRFEVADGSRVVPQVNPRMTEEDELLATFGRGLGLVAMCALAWGVDVHDSGKIVWFEPDATVAETPSDPVLDLPKDGGPERPAVVPDDYVTVTFDAMPVELIADFRRHYREVRRELRLLALAHETDYPVAKSLTQLFHRVDEINAAMTGLDELEKAVAAREERADLVFRVPPTAPATMTQLLELLELADEFCRTQRLLTLAATPQQFQLQRWFLGEFQRQAEGEAPLGWGGTYQVDRSYRQSAS
jgi:anti-sigma regulatory factor (Ser/Thr protein kinase)